MSKRGESYDEENVEFNEDEYMSKEESDGDSGILLAEFGTYEGETNSDNERHGLGKAVFPNGDVYVGDYKDGFRHGRGVYVFNNGAKYRGCYRNGLKNGKGVMCYPNKCRYEGYWSNNSKDGHGDFKYENGDTFSGTWKSDAKRGPGTYTFCKTGAVLHGTWSDDRRIGNFKIFFPTSTESTGFAYHGTWDGDESVTGEGYFVFEHLKCMQRGVHAKNPYRGTAKSGRGQRDTNTTWVPYQILPIVAGMLPRPLMRRPSFGGRPSCEPPVAVVRPTSPAAETYDRDENVWTETEDAFETAELDGETGESVVVDE